MGPGEMSAASGGDPGAPGGLPTALGSRGI